MVGLEGALLGWCVARPVPALGVGSAARAKPGAAELGTGSPALGALAGSVNSRVRFVPGLPRFGRRNLWRVRGFRCGQNRRFGCPSLGGRGGAAEQRDERQPGLVGAFLP